MIDRLVQAGLVAPLTPNGFEITVLDQIVINLVVPNNIALSLPVHCRILLTYTVEATTVGNTILISKGLIDTMPRNEATIASVISMELAHIALGHHIDTRYAFNDRLMFPDEATFQPHQHEPHRARQRKLQARPSNTCRPPCTRTAAHRRPLLGAACQIAARRSRRSTHPSSAIPC